MNARMQRQKEARARALTTTAMRDSPRWTPEMDVRVVNSRGLYAEIAELAAVWELSILTIQARWHVVRAR